MEAYLSFGMVTTFQPTDSLLVTHYLFNKLYHQTPYSDQPTFPEICIYGQDASPPWEIWSNYQHFKFPHQDYIYFFSKNEKHKSRYCRQVGSTGGTWSESDSHPLFIDGFEGEFGLLRKFRFEKKKKKRSRNVEDQERDMCDEQHGAWLMDEFTINQNSNLALCRLKMNRSSRGNRVNMVKNNVGDDGSLMMRSPQQPGKKKRKAGINIASSPIFEQPATQEMPSTSYHHGDHQLAQVVIKNRCNNFCDGLNHDGNPTFSHGNILMNQPYLMIQPYVQPQPSANSFPNDYQPIQMIENHENQTCCSPSPEVWDETYIDQPFLTSNFSPDEIQKLRMFDEHVDLICFPTGSAALSEETCVDQQDFTEEFFSPDEFQQPMMNDEHVNLTSSSSSPGLVSETCVDQQNSAYNTFDELQAIPMNDEHQRLTFSPGPFLNDANVEQQDFTDNYSDEFPPILTNDDHGKLIFSPFLNEASAEQQLGHDMYPDIKEHQKIMTNDDHGNAAHSSDAVLFNEAFVEQLDDTDLQPLDVSDYLVED